MKYRVAMWASTGFLVASGWAGYAFIMSPFTNERIRQVWIFASVTCPVIIAGQHFPIRLYWTLIANAATYALVGLFVETLRRTMPHSGTSRR